MNLLRLASYQWAQVSVVVILSGLAMLVPAYAQECYSGSEIDAVTDKAVQTAAQQLLNVSAQGDIASLKANALPEVVANFSGIEQAVVSHKLQFAQDTPSETRIFILDATNSKTTWPRADFYCGIYNSPGRVGISLPNLPPGRYALTITSLTGNEPLTLTMVLRETGQNAWRLGGYYVRQNVLGGHDTQWFLSKAREYKNKGQGLNAWFCYLTAWDLSAPADFISTPMLDKINDEMQAARPANLPNTSSPLELSAGGKTWKIIDFSALPMNGALYFRAQYDSVNAANSVLASQDNAALMKLLLTKYPELREAFGGIIARATDSAGHDFTTLTPMKDLK
jgi:hypothetical protein